MIKQAIYLSRIAFCIALGLSFLLLDSSWGAPNPKQPVPSPETMQAALWKAGEMHDFKLEGLMRTSRGSYPIVMRTRGRVVVIEFLNQPLQIYVRYTSEGSLVYRRKSSSEEWQQLSAQAKLERVLGSDVTYEDLGIEFLRWPNVRPLGGDSIKTLSAWAYEAQPSGPSQYSKANFWVSSDYLALLRVDAFNKKGELIKRVEINGVQRVGNAYTIQEMMISNLIPGRDISSSRTYIDIRKAEPGSGLSGDLAKL